MLGPAVVELMVILCSASPAGIEVLTAQLPLAAATPVKSFLEGMPVLVLSTATVIVAAGDAVPQSWALSAGRTISLPRMGSTCSSVLPVLLLLLAASVAIGAAAAAEEAPVTKVRSRCHRIWHHGILVRPRESSTGVVAGGVAPGVVAGPSSASRGQRRAGGWAPCAAEQII
jgi:hypothetical protein